MISAKLSPFCLLLDLACPGRLIPAHRIDQAREPRTWVQQDLRVPSWMAVHASFIVARIGMARFGHVFGSWVASAVQIYDRKNSISICMQRVSRRFLS
jgi:hypothetical protein